MPHPTFLAEPLEPRELFARTISFDQFFPVHYEFRWTYITEDRGTVEARFSNIRRRNGRGMFVITETDRRGATTNTTYRVDDTAIRVSKVTEATRRGKVTETTIFDPPLLYAPRKIVLNRKYIESSKVKILDDKGRRGNGTIKVTISTRGFAGATPFSLRGLPIRTITELDVTSSDDIRVTTRANEGAMFGQCSGFEHSVANVQYAIYRDGDVDAGLRTIGEYLNRFNTFGNSHCTGKLI